MKLERTKTRISEGNIAYADLGEGPPVVMVHGFPTSADLWTSEAMLLASRMRVIAPDLLGYGESDKPETADISIETQARYLGELMDELGIGDFAVVGHGIGGGIAQLLALDRGAKALVLIDSVILDTSPEEVVQTLQEQVMAQEQPDFIENVIRVTFDMGVEHKGKMDEGLLEAFIQPWRDDPAAFLRAGRSLGREGLEKRHRELAERDIDALVIWGEDDPFLSSELAERLGETLQRATVALLPACGHFVTFDAPHTVGPLMFEWLRQQYLGERHDPEHTGPVPVVLETRPDAQPEPDGDAGP